MRGHKYQEGNWRYSSTSRLTSALDGVGWLKPLPLPLCIGSWVSLSTGLDGRGKSLSQRDSITGPSQSVTSHVHCCPSQICPEQVQFSPHPHSPISLNSVYFLVLKVTFSPFTFPNKNFYEFTILSTLNSPPIISSIILPVYFSPVH